MNKPLVILFFSALCATMVCAVTGQGQPAQTGAQNPGAASQHTAQSDQSEEEYISPVTGKPVDLSGPWTLADYKARDERVMKKTGGFIDIPAAGPQLFVLDTRRREGAAIAHFCELYTRASKLPVKSAHEPRGNISPLAAAEAKMSKEKALMVVAVVEDCAELPALAVFPDRRIAIVNADALKSGIDPVAPEVRVEKDIWRAVGYTGGLGFTPAKNDLLKPIFTVEELDAVVNAYIQPMSFARMSDYLQYFKVQRPRRIPYRSAVKEGWAPPPTNDWQRVVWEEERNASTNATTNAAE